MLSKAVIAKSPTARFNLGMAYYNGGDMCRKMPSRHPNGWFAARQNFPSAHLLGPLLIEGEGGFEKHQRRAFLLRQAVLKITSLPANIFEKERGSFNAQKTVSKCESPRFFQFFMTDEEVPTKQEDTTRESGFTLRPSVRSASTSPWRNPVAARFVGLMALTEKEQKRPAVAKEWLSVSTKGDKTAKRLLDSYKSCSRYRLSNELIATLRQVWGG